MSHLKNGCDASKLSKGNYNPPLGGDVIEQTQIYGKQKKEQPTTKYRYVYKPLKFLHGILILAYIPIGMQCDAVQMIQ